MRNNLKNARKEKGMTQREVAEYLGIAESSYAKYESGERLGKIKHWDRLEDLFGIHQRILRSET